MMYLSRENDPGRGREWGNSPALPLGYMTPAMYMGLGEARQHAQPDRLEVSAPVVPTAQAGSMRLQDPRTLDAGRVLDFGAPAPIRVAVFAPYPYRPTEAPGQYQNVVPLGGRIVEVR